MFDVNMITNLPTVKARASKAETFIALCQRKSLWNFLNENIKTKPKSRLLL